MADEDMGQGAFRGQQSTAVRMGGFFKGQGGGMSGAGGKPRVQHSSLVPVTLKQIQMARQDPTEDKLLIDGREVTQVKVVGQVQEMTVANAGVLHTFHLDDGTAHTEVTVWLHDDGTGGADYHSQTKDEWRTGVYLEVFGSIKILSKDNKRTIAASRVHVVKDFNLITHHFLQCIHAHLFVLKGGNLGNHLQQVTGGMAKFDPYSFNNNASSSGVKQEYANNPYSSSLAPSNLNEAIIAQCKVAPLKGFSPEELVQRIPGHTLTEISAAVELLVNAGDIYSAHDNHYRA